MVYIQLLSKKVTGFGWDLGYKLLNRDPPYPHRTSTHMAPHVVKPRLPQLENISMNDFQCQAVLGRGHFGKVKSLKSQTLTFLLF